MLRSLRAASLALLLSAAGPPASAQHVWIVDENFGPGTDAINITGGVSLAEPGDILLIRGGSYGGTTIDGKGLSLVADTGAVVTMGPLQVRNVPAGQQVLVFGVGFANATVDPNIVLENDSGSVWLERCTIGTGNPSVSIEDCAAVTLRDCTATGHTSFVTGPSFTVAPASPAVRASGSAVALDGCTFTGGKGGDAFPSVPVMGAKPGAAAVEIESGTLFVGRSTLKGGAGGKGTSSGGFPPTCHDPKVGGPGLLLGAESPTVRLIDDVLVVGASGTAVSGCPPAGSPPPPVVVQSGATATLAGHGPELDTNSPVREGQLVSVTIAGAPGSAALLAFSLGSGVHALPPLSGTLGLAVPLNVLPLGALPGGGSLLLQATVPELGAGLEGVAVYLQAAAFDAGVGHMVLGQPTALTLLDGSI
jgi:hypothetical protein